MAYEVPTIQTLITRVLARVASRLNAGPYSKGTVEYVFSFVVAAATHGVYRMLSWLYRQLIPDTAGSESVERWAAIFGITRDAAEKHQGSGTFTATTPNPTDVVSVPLGTQFFLSDNTVYRSTSLVSRTGSGSLEVPLQAVNPGADGSASAGDRITAETAIAYLKAEGVVSSGGLQGGSDQEQDRPFHIRFLRRVRQPGRCGGPGDYVEWAKDAPGVDFLRAYEFPRIDGPGTVGVSFLVNGSGAGVIPDAGSVAAMQTFFDGVAPVDMMWVRVFAPAAVNVTVDVGSLVLDSGAVLSVVRSAIHSALSALFKDEAKVSIDFQRERITETIGRVPGVNTYNVDAPLVDVSVPSGSVAVFSALSFDAVPYTP